MFSNVGAIHGGCSRSATDYRFFHCEMEFPEVFFDERGSALPDPGFDAIIGNPPWGSVFSPDQKLALKQLFHEVHMRTPESSLYFVAACWSFVRRQGLVGL